MTCIIGLEHHGHVYIGGDSAGANDWDIQAVAARKVFQVDSLLIGYTSSFRLGQLLQYNLAVPDNPFTHDIPRYMVAKLIPAIRECLKAGGYAKIENNVESGGGFLVGYHGQVYLVGNDFQITRMADGLTAVGCGRNYALGALAAQPITHPKRAILHALAIAGHFSNGVCGPYYVLTL